MTRRTKQVIVLYLVLLLSAGSVTPSAYALSAKIPGAVMTATMSTKEKELYESTMRTLHAAIAAIEASAEWRAFKIMCDEIVDIDARTKDPFAKKEAVLGVLKKSVIYDISIKVKEQWRAYTWPRFSDFPSFDKTKDKDLYTVGDTALQHLFNNAVQELAADRFFLKRGLTPQEIEKRTGGFIRRSTALLMIVEDIKDPRRITLKRMSPDAPFNIAEVYNCVLIPYRKILLQEQSAFLERAKKAAAKEKSAAMDRRGRTKKLLTLHEKIERRLARREPAYKNKFLPQPIIENNYMIQHIVNPQNEEKVVGYLFSGANILNVEIATRGARRFYFIDHIPFDRERFNGFIKRKWDTIENNYAYEEYGEEMHHYGYSNGHPKMERIESKLAFELIAMGVRAVNHDGAPNIRVDENNGMPTIRFMWQAPGSAVEKEYTISYIQADIVAPERYPPAFRELLESGEVDIWFLNAAIDVVEESETFAPSIRESMKVGDHFVVNDVSSYSDRSNFKKIFLDKKARASFAVHNYEDNDLYQKIWEQCYALRESRYGWEKDVYEKVAEHNDGAELFEARPLVSA
ncbi:MAG: hypothetical protein JW938_06390 [Candidatus Omnitrophica bacterium]|nr:hypothetical protein [Candidatus Omnitrophota bacterium]